MVIESTEESIALSTCLLVSALSLSNICKILHLAAWKKLSKMLTWTMAISENALCPIRNKIVMVDITSHLYVMNINPFMHTIEHFSFVHLRLQRNYINIGFCLDIYLGNLILFQNSIITFSSSILWIIALLGLPLKMENTSHDVLWLCCHSPICCIWGEMQQCPAVPSSAQQCWPRASQCYFQMCGLEYVCMCAVYIRLTSSSLDKSCRRMSIFDVNCFYTLLRNLLNFHIVFGNMSTSTFSVLDNLLELKKIAIVVVFVYIFWQTL